MFNIPNAADAEDVTQAQPDSRDFSAMIAAAFSGTGVVTGCAVTAQATPNMTVAVAAGTVAINGTSSAVTGANVTISAANATNPRFDLICVAAGGVLSAVTGTAAAAPVFPDPAGKVVLAAVRVPAGATAINSQKIVDKRLQAVLPSTITTGTITTAMLQDGAVTDPKIAGPVSISKLAGFPNDRTTFLDGSGVWRIPTLGGFNTQTGNYTIALIDSNRLVEMNVASANSVTVPNDSIVNFPVGANVDIAQLGTGVTGLVAASGVTLRAYNNNLHLAGQNAIASVIKRAANDWWAVGNLVP